MEATNYIISFMQNGEFECTQTFTNEARALEIFVEYGNDIEKQNLTLTDIIVEVTGSV
jgi:hypothetical protein